MKPCAAPLTTPNPSPHRRGWALGFALLVTSMATTLSGCTSSPAAQDPLPETPGQTRAQRLLALDSAIEADYDRLLELIVEPTRVDSIPLRENPELLEIAKRLPRLQAERQRLEDPPAGQQGPAPGDPP